MREDRVGIPVSSLHHAMNSQLQTFCVEDTCANILNPTQLGTVERTSKEVDSHEPNPQKHFPQPIKRHELIPREDFDRFLRDGIPPDGTVLVAWKSPLSAELIPEASLILLDRWLEVGHAVKKHPQQPMCGIVIGTEIYCDVVGVNVINDLLENGPGEEGGSMGETINKSLLREIPSRELYHAHEYRKDSIIVYDDWIGIIEDCEDEITVRLGNGSVVVVENPEELQSQSHFPLDRFSVGDIVVTKKGNLRRGRWKLGAFNPNVPPKGTVVEVRTISVLVRWQCRRLEAPTRPNVPGSFTTEPPLDVLDIDELDSGNVYVYDSARSPTGVQTHYHNSVMETADRVRFRDLTAAEIKYDGSTFIDGDIPQGKLTRLPRTATSGYDMNVFFIMSAWTEVRVLWQDATITEERSTSLILDTNDDDENEVWPGEIVHTTQAKSKEGQADENDGDFLFEPAKIGVVQSVSPSDRIASVRWCPEADAVFFNMTDVLGGAKIGRASDTVEEVSVYDIKPSKGLTRQRGDIVMIHPAALSDGMLPEGSTGLDWLGEVVDLDLDGSLTVRLGLLNPVVDIKVAPEKTTLAYGIDSLDSILSDSADGSEEEEDDESMDYYESDRSEESYNERWYEYQEPDGTRVVPEDQDEGDEAWSTEDEDENSIDGDGDMTMADTSVVETSSTTPLQQPEPDIIKPQADIAAGEATNPAQNALSSLLSASDGHIERFAILDESPPDDHHFIGHSEPSQDQRQLRRIQKEYKILQSSLPDGIYVRSWASRLDLLRVVVIGPVDTPYEYAPFLIDLHLEPRFPTMPPDAFFHSWADSVNPNLYENGKICLSLLGTWHTDDRYGGWIPAKSTILQLLVSIMGLVLVKQPYYNEAGYEVRAGSEDTVMSAALYSERTYFRSRAFITHVLTTPVSGFQDVIQWLYLDKSDTSPKLLEKAIAAGRATLERSEHREGVSEQHDGLRRISRGAAIQLRRQIVLLESLQK